MTFFKKKKYDDIEHIKQKSVGSVFKTAGIAFLVILVVLVASQSTYQIREQEQAVLTTFGTAQSVTTPGLHFKVPFIQQVSKVNTTIKGFSIGYDETTNEVIEEEAEQSLKEVLSPWEYADVFDSGKVEFRFKFLEYFFERAFNERSVL